MLPPEGPPRTLALAQLAGAIGYGGFLVASALFFSQVVRLSAAHIGLGLTVGWGLGILAAVPLGHLADRRGARGTAVALALAAALSAGSFLFVRSLIPFMVAFACYAICQSGLDAARQAALAGLVSASERTRVRAILQSTANAGLAVGAGMGGIALWIGSAPAYLTIFAIDAAGFVLTAVLLSRLPSIAPNRKPRRSGEPALAVLRDRPYVAVSLLNMVMVLYRPVLSLVIPLWIVEVTQAPSWLVSAMMVLNTLCVVVFQVRVAGRVTDLGSATRAVAVSGMVIFAACGVFALSAFWPQALPAVVILLVGAALLVAGEMLLSSGAWEISFGLAPADKHGQYQGFFGTGTSIARMLGPVLLTTLVLGWGVPGWLVLGGVFVLAGFAMRPAVTWAERRNARRDEELATT